MTAISCDDTLCFYCNEGTCAAEKIDISGNICCTAVDYTEQSPEYQNEYWIAIKAKGQGKRSRRKRKGYRYKYKDLVLYTESDIRKGIDEAYFTEETTGFACGYGKDLEKNYELIKKKKDTCTPVLNLPMETPADEINNESEYPY